LNKIRDGLTIYFDYLNAALQEYFLYLCTNKQSMKQRLYPVGQQDFPAIINEGKIYVDKTMYALDIIITSKYNFLSKPRRFGKSLFISTLESIFKGQKELFEGLYIYDKWAFEEYPVIRISYSNIGYRTMGLQKAISNELLNIASRYQIEILSRAEDISNMFNELIVKLHKKFNQEVVILIDEYDKPIIDYLNKEDIQKALENRNVMKTFYSILKDAEPHLKLVFITGVSKFTKVSIFSDLNNLTDLTMHPSFNEICGISQKELEANFDEELKLYDKEKIKEWYNGYKWDIDGDTVYNPFSILSFFHNKGKFQNFWYTSGTPTFLMKMCRHNHFYKFDQVSIHTADVGNFDIENLKIIPVLFQTGYLTIIKEDILNSYVLSFPNIEVRESYLRNLADTYINSDVISSTNILQDILKSLDAQDEELLKSAINQAFAQIPYSLWVAEKEKFYHALVHLLFSLLGVYIFSEVQTKKGRADAVIYYEDQVYCLEFKLDKTAEDAIQQIESKAYTERFQNSGKPIHHIGINFNSELREVDGLIWNLPETHGIK
jgi:Predicted AAA-ATPase/PD-(D/E)XK nuclease superfamily